MDGALNAALEIHDRAAADTSDQAPMFQIALHRGVALSTSVDGRAEVFGRSLAQANAMSDGSEQPLLLLSEDLKNDPDCQEILGLKNRTLRPAATRAGIGSFAVTMQIYDDRDVATLHEQCPRASHGTPQEVDVERPRR